jgi:hypothetical protein
MNYTSQIDGWTYCAHDRVQRFCAVCRRIVVRSSVGEGEPRPVRGREGRRRAPDQEQPQ